MEDPRARAALGIPDGERIVVTIDLGEPVVEAESKPRRAAADFTTWLP
jgi:nitroreductase